MNNEEFSQLLREYLSKDVDILFYREDECVFNELWEFGRDRKTLIIETEGNEIVPADMEGAHLDAACWANLLQYKNSSSSKTIAPIGILDLRVQNVQHFFKNLSGVSVFKPTSFGLDNLLRWIDDQRLFPPALSEELLQFKKRWLLELADSDSRENHHYLNNTLAPLAIAAHEGSEELLQDIIEGVPKYRYISQSNLRKKLFSGMDILLKNEYPDGGCFRKKINCCLSGFEEALSETGKDYISEIRVILVDDQAHDGWLSVFAHCFGFHRSMGIRCTDLKGSPMVFKKIQVDCPDLSLYIYDCPDPVLDVLENMECPSQAGLPIPFRVVSSQQERVAEILFLDLRLYSENVYDRSTKKIKDEEVFQKKMTNLFEKWGIKNITNIAEVDALDDLVALPMIIAECDYSYPLIIFSSTGQRGVSEKLKKYKNIFTGLEKPRFDLYFERGLDSFLESVDEALKWAIALIQSRFALDAGGDGLVFTETINPIKNRISSSDSVLVDLYLDESRRPEDREFPVGGVLAIWLGTDGQNISEIKSRALNVIKNKKISLSNGRERFLLNGKSYCERGSLVEECKSDGKLCKEHDRRRAEDLNIILNTLHGICQNLLVLPIKAETCVVANENTWFKEKSLDGRYYDSVPLLLESVLCDFLGGGKNVEISVKIDFRQIPIKSLPESDRLEVLYEYFRRFNYEWSELYCSDESGEKKIYKKLRNYGIFKEFQKRINVRNWTEKIRFKTVTDAWVHNSLFEIWRRRLKSVRPNAIISARAISMTSNESVFSFLADSVLYKNNFNYLVDRRTCLFEKIGDNRLDEALQSARCFDNDEIADSAFKAVEAIQNPSTGKFIKEAPILLSDIVFENVFKNLISALKRDDFFRYHEMRLVTAENSM